MSDVFSRAERSEVMSRIRGKGNAATELAMVRLFRAAGVTGWRRHPAPTATLPGRPDFVFRRERVAVFVDGCFWHGCPRHATRPKNNRAFWDAKLAANRARDRRVSRQLRRLGWTVLRVWEHALRERPARVVARIREALNKPR